MKRSKAATFAKAHRELKPKPLHLQIDEMLGNHRNPNLISFRVNSDGQFVVQDWSFSPRDALRLAAWITENFR